MLTHLIVACLQISRSRSTCLPYLRAGAACAWHVG